MLSGPDEEDATGGDGGSGADLRRPADRDRRAGRRHATVLLIGRVMHAEHFDGYLPYTAVPEASTGVWGLLASGLLLRRRRSEGSV